LFTVDYQINNGLGMHFADLSFTFLHWKMVEELSNETILLQNIDHA
jgi:hypothetical protein